MLCLVKSLESGNFVSTTVPSSIGASEIQCNYLCQSININNLTFYKATSCSSKSLFESKQSSLQNSSRMTLYS